MKSTHPNSRVVTIYRKGSFIADAQQNSAPEFMQMSKQSIGSYYENSYSKTIGSGLNFAEQALLMVSLVDCPSEDRNFRQKVSEYFANIKTAVPYDKGRKLEIGLTEDNNKPLSAKNQPLNLSDYITYRHALGHPLVAPSKEAADGDMLKQYYIFDPQAAEDSQVKIDEMKDKALEIYLKVKNSPEKIDMVLTLLKEDPRLFTGKNAEAKKLTKLKEYADNKPLAFVEAFSDKHLEDSYTLMTMANTGVLRQVGEKYIDLETGETLGHNLKEAIAWMKDKANSDRVVILKARLQEATSKKPATQKAV